MKSPAAVRAFFETLLQRVRHFKVDVIAGNAKAAAYMHCKNQEYQDLYDFSVVVMLREMQLEVRRIDHSTKNHPPQLHAANDLDCCSMAILSWRKPVRPRILRKLSLESGRRFA